MRAAEALIEVVTTAGDRAEAPSPEAALVAARTLLRDARYASSGAGLRVSASVLVNGVLVRSGITASVVGA